MGVDTHLVSRITNYLKEWPQLVRLKDCLSDTVVSSPGAPRGTILSPVLFTLYTSDFCYNTESYHMQKFSDNTAIVGCIRDVRVLGGSTGSFVQWCRLNHLQLNTAKTKEMVVGLCWSKPTLLPVSIEEGQCGHGKHIQVSGDTPGPQTGLVSQHSSTLQERAGPALLPEEAVVL